VIRLVAGSLPRSVRPMRCLDSALLRFSLAGLLRSALLMLGGLSVGRRLGKYGCVSGLLFPALGLVWPLDTLSGFMTALPCSLAPALAQHAPSYPFPSALPCC